MVFWVSWIESQIPNIYKPCSVIRALEDRNASVDNVIVSGNVIRLRFGGLLRTDRYNKIFVDSERGQDSHWRILHATSLSDIVLQDHHKQIIGNRPIEEVLYIINAFTSVEAWLEYKDRGLKAMYDLGLHQAAATFLIDELQGRRSSLKLQEVKGFLVAGLEQFPEKSQWMTKGPAHLQMLEAKKASEITEHHRAVNMMPEEL
ncbi:hypothetical protein K8R42_03865 [bacterium]|nr:hypothetical protein [bacterium]